MFYHHYNYHNQRQKEVLPVKTFLYVDPAGTGDFVTELCRAHGARRGMDPSGQNVDQFYHLGVIWQKTLHGFQVEFGYLLRKLPPALTGTPIARVVITARVDTDVLLEGLYEPEGEPFSGQVDVHYSASVGGGHIYDVRVEATAEDNADPLEDANRFFLQIRRKEVMPTTSLARIARACV